MRKETLDLINVKGNTIDISIYNDIVGGLYNAMLDEIEEKFTNFKGKDIKRCVAELIYNSVIFDKKDSKFDGKENIINYVLQKLDTDKDVKEIIEYVNNLK